MPEQFRKLHDRLREKGANVLTNVSMREHSTFRIGGVADSFVEIESAIQLITALRESTSVNHPRIVIGNGSNVLFSDESIRALVIKVNQKLAEMHLHGDRFLVEAGVSARRAAMAAYRAGLSGLEHVVGIPGTMGGLVVMNGGSQRKCIGDLVEWIDVCDGKGRVRRLNRSDCRFGYRNSIFLERNDLTVLCYSLSLRPGDPGAIRRAMLGCLSARKRKYPLKQPSAGSVFKSSPEIHDRFGSPGKLIEALGLKGLRCGGAQISEKHGNFIVNAGGAKATDVLALVRLIRDKARQEYGISMEAEVRYISPEGAQIPLSAL